MEAADFERRVAPFRRELYAHCYRMLGSCRAFVCHQAQPDGTEALNALNLLRIRDGRIAEIAGFLDPELHRRLGLGG